MHTTPCYNTIEARRDQRSHDRLADQADRLETLREELANDMRKAMRGEIAHVPGTVTRGFGRRREVLEDAEIQMLDALNANSAVAALRAMLKDSQCPLVAQLRDAVAMAYAADVAENVFEAREGL